jgi:hypothetical protein
MTTGTTAGPDQRALKILFDTYWRAARWASSDERSTTPDDFEYAKRAGLMFDEIQLSHEDIVSQAILSTRVVDRQTVANGFAFSLSSRRLEFRSALGSFAVLQHFPKHAFPRRCRNCPVCGAYESAAETEDLNVLNFERFKWGGVRHDKPLYASFDLMQFQRLPEVAPSATDVEILKGLLHAIEDAPPTTTSASLEKHLGKCFKSNKAEREILIGILGLCGTLETAAHPGYMQRFIPQSERELPGRRFVDLAYPACWWQPSDGVNRKAVGYWFGHLS